jgi:hypothetical protein
MFDIIIETYDMITPRQEHPMRSSDMGGEILGRNGKMQIQTTKQVFN